MPYTFAIVTANKNTTVEKFKKVDKPFLLSDSSVNSYGFRLLTSGYQKNEFVKNPIGYRMHLRDEGVVVRWDDIKVDGDKITGKPVINLNHPKGQQCFEEIENGFLNAASVGHIVALEISDDPALKLPNQVGPTITKWFNRECSLVDIPGNFNALKLYDKDEQEINLADFSKTKILPDMKQIFFTPAQLQAMNLTADASETAVAAAFTNLVAKAAKAEALQTQLNDLNAQVCKDKVEGVLTAALAAGKVTKEVAEKLKVTYANDPDNLKQLVDAMPTYQPVAKRVEDLSAAKQKHLADLSAKTFDQLMESGELDELKKHLPEVYAEKVKERKE